MKAHLGLPLLLAGATLWSHPMGNFSVSHYSLLQPDGSGLKIRYVLDLAEIPTFQLFQGWKLDEASPRAQLQQRAEAQAREWGRNLRIVAEGRTFAPQIERASLALDKGAGGMAVLRVTSEFRAAVPAGRFRYEDLNFPDRAGWKEIVVEAGDGAAIRQASPGGSDRSRGLTVYPQDPLIAPPQDLQAAVEWQMTRPPAPAVSETETAAPSAVPAAAPADPPPSAAQPGQSAPGMVVRGDYLSRLLKQGEIGWGMMLAGMVVAFGLGAVHALSPGHGKTIVAAYLVGTRGTPRHALFLGGMVTFTHTISVFALGIVTLFLSQYVLPEKIYPVLGAISGISIVWIGGTLFFKRLRAAKRHTHGHDHAHGPDHHTHDHHHEHSHGGLTHDHGDGRVHSHMPEGDVTMASLIALGASGGLVPCPSALVLLLSAVALGRVALGLTLLVAFSAGLAVVLSGIGLIVLYARNLLPDRSKAANSRAFRYLPVASAAVITCAGILMTGIALGVIRPFPGV